jgi:DNA-binding CsgD family transcriptional regulator
MYAFDDQTRLIRALFAETQADTQEAWTGFLSLLRQITQAEGASLTLDHQNQTRSWRDGSPNYVDPLSRQPLRFDRVYSQESLTAPEAGGAPTRLIKVRAASGAGVTLSVTRKTHERDFRSADGQVLHGLAPFLGQAMGLWLDRQRERADARTGGAMLTALGGAWLILDGAGRVSRFSANLPTGLQAAEGLPPKFTDPATSSAYAEAFAQAVTGKKPATLSLDRGEMLLTRIEHENTPAVLGRIRTIPRRASISAQAFAQHFGVSTSEARLAILICDGHSLKVAAAMLGWTEETTRTCSKRLMARLGVCRQPELVRRVLNSSLWFAAGST